MTTAVAKVGDGRSPGRPTKFTPEVRAELIRCFEQGAPISVACAMARISQRCYHLWMSIARGEVPETPPSDAYLQFLHDVQAAISRHSMHLLASVKTTVEGRYCLVCTDGIYEAPGKFPAICPVCKGTEESRKPDGKLALQVLERKHPEYRKPEPSIRVEQHITGSVDINVTALTMDLATMTPEQLLALTGGEERDVIEAGEAEGE